MLTPDPSSHSTGPARVVATPAQLDELALRTAGIGRRVEELAACASATLRDLGSALPRSTTASVAQDVGARCAELLRAEGQALRSLGEAFRAAAAFYRANESRIVRGLREVGA